LKHALDPRDCWNVGIINKPLKDILDNFDNETINWIKIENNNFYYADPFVIKKDNKIIIFFENYSVSSSKANIAYIEYENNNSSKIKISKEDDFHISYPFIFEYNNSFYCIPETSENNEIALYKINEINKLEKIKTLINIPGLDSTLLHYDNTWWIFFTVRSDGPNSKLHIWYSKDLFGDWKPHKDNPVKIDSSSSRPAGPFFQIDDELYRPSQNCSRLYGQEVIINKILELNINQYRECSVRSLKPQKNSVYNYGLHTVSSIEKITVIDGLTYKRDLVWMKIRLDFVLKTIHNITRKFN
jgi:hypothetical protein